MDFMLTEEQKMIKASARAFMEGEIIPIVGEYEQKYRPLPKEIAIEVMKKLVPLGYIGGLVPEDGGGEGMDYVSYAILTEELARAWGSLTVMTIVDAAAGPLDLYYSGSEEQKAKYLPPALSGDLICSGAISEPNVGSGTRDIETTAKVDGDYYIINGTKEWITNGGVSDFYSVTLYTDRAKGAQGVSRIIVDANECKLAIRELPKLGLRCCPTAEVVFDNCRVPRKNLLDQEGVGYEATMKLLLTPRALLGVMGTGLAQAAIDEAVKYALERKQFGRIIAKFQLVQQMIAEMVVETKAARLLCYEATQLLGKGERCFKECSGAKFYGTEVAVRVCSKAMEVLGAYGISEEYPLERYFRDARTLLPPDGTNQIQRLIVGREVLGVSAFV